MARPKLLADGMVEFKTSYLAADNTALNSLARATGEAKASHLRRALSQYLATFELANPAPTSVLTHPIKKGTLMPRSWRARASTFTRSAGGWDTAT